MKKSAEADAIDCPHCGYNLAALPTFRCPECGHEFDKVLLLRAETRPARWRTVFIACLVGPGITAFGSTLVMWFAHVDLWEGVPWGGFVMFVGIAASLPITLARTPMTARLVQRQLIREDGLPSKTLYVLAALGLLVFEGALLGTALYLTSLLPLRAGSGGP